MLQQGPACPCCLLRGTVLKKRSACSCTQGASTVLYAATSTELEGGNILYLHASKAAEPSRLAQDRALAQQLWDASEGAVGLK